MNIKSKILLCSAILLIVVSCISSNGKKIEITGAVRLVGNEPFSKLVLSTINKKHYYFPSKMKKKYIKYLNQIIQLTGFVKKSILRSADHKYKTVRYKLVSIENIKKVRSVF